MVRLRVTGAFIRDAHGIPVTQNAIGEFDDDKAKSYVARGLAVYVEATDEPDGGKPLDQLKVDELRAYAAERGIALGDATKKADIIAAITAAEGATPVDYSAMSDDELLNAAVDAGIEVPEGTDRDALIALLNEKGAGE